MIIFLTRRGHEKTLRRLARPWPIRGRPTREGPARGGLAVSPPRVAIWSYERLFRAKRIPQATIVFTDIERLAWWETRIAAAMFRTFRDSGLTCLNDPARVKIRYPLLRTLHRLGINPFNVYRADDQPRPERFPVFVRSEQDHGRGFIGKLLQDQGELEARLAQCVEEGIPLNGLIVVEFCAEPVAPGIWRKLGTFRVGSRYQVQAQVTQDSWLVKHGTPDLCPDWLYMKERETVVQNRIPDALPRAFEAGAIDFGRADHASVNGVEVIYEINTNPMFPSSRTIKVDAIRQPALIHSTNALMEALWDIDSGDGRAVRFAPIDDIAGPLRRSRLLRRPLQP